MSGFFSHGRITSSVSSCERMLFSRISRSAATLASSALGSIASTFFSYSCSAAISFWMPGGGVVLKLRVVLVQPGAGARRRREVKVDVAEVLVGDEVEGLRRAVGGDVLGRRCRWA